MLFRFFILVSTLLTLIGAGNSQTKIVTDVEEAFSSRVAVSGSIIVGAMLGPLTGKTDTSDLMFNMPTNAAYACFSSKTRDGQYWSEARMRIPEDHSGMSQLDPTDGWQYLDELSLYGKSDFAALVRLGENCRIDPDAPILPVQFEAEGDGMLTIALNAQRAYRVSAVLETMNGDINLGGTCNRPDANIRSTAFNYLCSFDLEGVETGVSVTLVINSRTRVGPRRYDATIYIP